MLHGVANNNKIPGFAGKGSYMEIMPVGKRDPQFLVRKLQNRPALAERLDAASPATAFQRDLTLLAQPLLLFCYID